MSWLKQANTHYKMINTNDPNDAIDLTSTTLEEALQEALAHAGYQVVTEPRHPAELTEELSDQIDREKGLID